MHMRLRIIRELRKQIFAFQEAAESSLELESQQQLRTAAALKLLEMRLRDTGITPDNFDEFDDKEYVRNVIKYINTNAARLYAKCATTEQSAIEDVLAAITVSLNMITTSKTTHYTNSGLLQKSALMQHPNKRNLFLQKGACSP